MKNTPAYWLMKTEPDVFSIDTLKAQKTAPWDGVRNYSARNHMRAMQLGNLVLFYHSSTEPVGIAGIAKVCKLAYPDHTAFDSKNIHYDPKSTKKAPTWFMVDVAFVEKFKHFVSLAELKAQAKLKNMTLFRRGRLSVQPVAQEEFEWICGLGRP